jgi:hypothetical protein
VGQRARDDAVGGVCNKGDVELLVDGLLPRLLRYDTKVACEVADESDLGRVNDRVNHRGVSAEDDAGTAAD